MLYEVPGGNQVDGLPPAASNTGAGVIWWPIPIIHCPFLAALARLVLEILVSEFDLTS